jgi:membrane protein DedA with SNARE-associated domain/uncharacterized tellurite resistance protein B-like protein
LIRQLLEWLAGLPPLPVYATLGLISAIENILPPVPADTAVALGAFLSHKHVTTPLTVFLVVWFSNVGGAAAVYWASRRYGRRFFATPAGRRLLSPSALAVVEREYLRFGIVGIFLGKLLPGVRAVVAPFTGIANLSAPRALLPMAVASGLWYGGLTLIGTVLGAQWDRIEEIIGTVNRTLGVFTVLLVAAVAAVVLLRRRRRRRERLLLAASAALEPARTSVGSAIGAAEAAEAADGADPIRTAALLLLELAYADPAFDAADRDEVCRHVRDRWGLPEGPAPAFHPVEQSRLASYRDRLTHRFGHEQRLELVERLWTVVFNESALGPQGSRLMRLAADLLGLGPDELHAAARGLDAGRDDTWEERP